MQNHQGPEIQPQEQSSSTAELVVKADPQLYAELQTWKQQKKLKLGSFTQCAA